MSDERERIAREIDTNLPGVLLMGQRLHLADYILARDARREQAEQDTGSVVVRWRAARDLRIAEAVRDACENAATSRVGDDGERDGYGDGFAAGRDYAAKEVSKLDCAAIIASIDAAGETE